MNQFTPQSKSRERRYLTTLKKCILAGALVCLGLHAQAQFHQNLSFRAFNNNVVDCGTMSTVFENNNSYSVEVRVKFNLFTLWGNVFAKRSTQSNRDIVLQSSSSNGQIGVAVGNGYGTSTTHLLQGVWYHIAIVYEGTNSTDATRLKLFINGVQETLTISGVPTVSPVSTGSRFVMGAEYNGTTAINNSSFVQVPFDGAIDELRIWDNARTQAEIVANMNTELTVPQSNLAAYYQFNQGSACGSNTGQTSLPDVTGTYNATLWHFLLTGLLSNYTTVVDTSVSVFASTFTANANPASYQWYDCTSHSIISGQTANNYTATNNGTYAVIVTQDFCVDTSSCYNITGAGINEINAAGDVRIYPNPAKSVLNIELNRATEIRIIDGIGRTVLEKNFSENYDTVITLDISFLAPGIYSLQTGKRIVKFMKE